MSNSPSPLTEILSSVGARYHRLLVITATNGAGMTTTLERLATQLGTRRVTVNGALAERLLDLAPGERRHRSATLLDAVVAAASPGPAILDNIEILFDASLLLDPLQLLSRLSRHRTIIVGWPGTWDGTTLTYAEPGHAEHHRAAASDVMVLPLGELLHLLAAASSQAP